MAKKSYDSEDCVSRGPDKTIESSPTWLDGQVPKVSVKLGTYGAASLCARQETPDQIERGTATQLCTNSKQNRSKNRKIASPTFCFFFCLFRSHFLYLVSYGLSFSESKISVQPALVDLYPP